MVALESTIISHGLPAATSAQTAREIEAAVRRGGAVPATVAVVDGAVRVGLSDDQLVHIAEDPGVVKTSVRDLGIVLATGTAGATTVAATAYLAHRAGIRLFATGGLGGVHRGARESWDESADLAALATAPVTVVCAGVKSILDVPATVERLETLSVPLLGYGTDTVPGFYVRDTGLPVPWRVDTPEEVADGDARPPRAAGCRRAWWWRSRWRPTTRWTPGCTSARSPRGWPRSSGAASPARTSRRSCSAGSTSRPRGRA